MRSRALRKSRARRRSRSRHGKAEGPQYWRAGPSGFKAYRDRFLTALLQNIRTKPPGSFAALQKQNAINQKASLERVIRGLLKTCGLDSDQVKSLLVTHAQRYGALTDKLWGKGKEMSDRERRQKAPEWLAAFLGNLCLQSDRAEVLERRALVFSLMRGFADKKKYPNWWRTFKGSYSSLRKSVAESIVVNVMGACAPSLSEAEKKKTTGDLLVVMEALRDAANRGVAEAQDEKTVKKILVTYLGEYCAALSEPFREHEKEWHEKRGRSRRSGKTSGSGSADYEDWGEGYRAGKGGYGGYGSHGTAAQYGPISQSQISSSQERQGRGHRDEHVKTLVEYFQSMLKEGHSLTKEKFDKIAAVVNS